MCIRDSAYGTAKHVAARDGVPIGISSGAAVAAALIVGARPNMQGKRIVTIIPSFAERYLSTPLFDAEETTEIRKKSES